MSDDEGEKQRQVISNDEIGHYSLAMDAELLYNQFKICSHATDVQTEIDNLSQSAESSVVNVTDEEKPLSTFLPHLPIRDLCDDDISPPMGLSNLFAESQEEIKVAFEAQVPTNGMNNREIITSSRKIILNQFIEGTKKNDSPTHFLSIPIKSEGIVNSFKKFKELVLSENADGVDETIFMREEKLHLTLGVSNLRDKEKRTLASQLLSEAKTNVVEPLLKGVALNIHLKGIACMNNNPHSARVLYSSVEDVEGCNGNMQILANKLNSYFVEKGLAKKEKNNEVKLHMTLMNSKYRKITSNDNPEPPVKKKRIKRQSFDMSKILEKYQDFDFGKHTVTEIHLSQLFAKGPDGYYLPTCVVTV